MENMKDIFSLINSAIFVKPLATLLANRGTF